MHLIKAKAFLEREELIRKRSRVGRRAKILNFGDDEATEYVILSHRRVGQEMDYEEICQRDGYGMILQCCKQPQKDRYGWWWFDACCIDKRSRAEPSDTINSTYRWYENAKVRYAYLHDVPSPSFPTVSDNESYITFNG